MTKTVQFGNGSGDWIGSVIFLAPLLYLDPGNGSLVIQAIVAAVLSFLYFTRQFWTNLFSRFSRRNPKGTKENDGEPGNT